MKSASIRAASAAAIIWLASAGTLAAQNRSGADSAFSDLRRDGNGIEELRARVNVSFDGQRAGAALQAIASLARLNLTFDPRLPGLTTPVSIAEHDRSAAAALIEVASASHLRLRVSASGQLVVVAAGVQRTEVADTTPRAPVTLPAVRTQATRIERQDFETHTNVGGVSITGRELSAAPQFVEPDVLRSVQLLPGIAARSDYTAGFNVRGGEADQTLVLIDGYPIYDPFHLGGVFSTFIDATVGRVDLRSGAMPAQYGGRLSGVLNVRSAEPARDDLHGTADVSLVSSSASVGEAFANNAGSWMVAARRTYADAVVNLVKPGAFPYHFQDGQAHLTHTIPGGLRFSVTAYGGVDAATSSADADFRTSWGNSVIGTTLSKRFAHPSIGAVPLGDSIVVEQRASLSRFDAIVRAPQNFFYANNDVADRRIGGSVAVHSSGLTQTLGYELATQHLSYNTNSVISGLSDFFPFDSLDQRSRSTSVFLDELWRVSPRLLVDVGARTDAVAGQPLGGVSPRLSLKYFLNPTVAITAAAGSYRQWIHSLGREEEPVEPLQLWIASDTSAPVSRARDAIVGLERWVTPSRLLHVEAFYKRYDHLPVPNALSDPSVPGDNFSLTTGTSYGADVLLRQFDEGPFSGWLAYTYAVSTRVTADGAHYFPGQDRRHNLNLVGSWRSDAYTFGARFNFASGLPYTPALGSYLRSVYDPATRRWVPDNGGLDQQMISGEYNSARLPEYNRLDVSVTRTSHVRGATVAPYLSVVNLLNAHNPAAYIYNFVGISRRSSFPNLPFAPTFGVSIAY